IRFQAERGDEAADRVPVPDDELQLDDLAWAEPRGQSSHGLIAGGAVEGDLASEAEHLPLGLGQARIVLAALLDCSDLLGARADSARDCRVLDPLVLGV